MPSLIRFDTSGKVIASRSSKGVPRYVTWDQLDKFEQGALYAAANDIGGIVHFSDFSGRVLGRIRADCQAWQSAPANTGMSFWINRQLGRLPDFTPVTFSRDVDGLIQIEGETL